MASIKRTAYPRFSKLFSPGELEKIFTPTIAELNFVTSRSTRDRHQLTFLVLLKTHQYLGYFPAMIDVPKQVSVFLGRQLELPKNIAVLNVDSNKKTLQRYRRIIREYLGITPWSKQANIAAEVVIEKSAVTMSSPADLINVAIEKLVEQRCELPAFSTLNRMVGQIRKKVNQQLYNQISSRLSLGKKRFLDNLLKVKNEDRITDFTRLKQSPGKPSLKLG